MSRSLFFAAFLSLASALPASAQTGTPFECEEGNYSVSYSAKWKPTRSPNAIFQLGLSNGQNALFVSGLETPATPEELLDAMKTGQKAMGIDFQPLSQEETSIAGERALRVRAQTKVQGMQGYCYLTVFNHQGIAYRLLGVKMQGRPQEFEAEYNALLASFRFLGNRAKWLEQFEGKPVRTAMLGGLVSFELNRPRWIETSLDDQGRREGLEDATFKLSSSGAWIHMRCKETSTDAVAELESLKHWFTTIATDAQSVAGAATGAQGDVRTVEVTGKQLGHDRRYRAAAFVTEGIAVHVWLESLSSQSATVQRDWEQLLASLTLQPKSKPAEPLAYPCRQDSGQAGPDPALAAFLAHATQVLDAETARLTRAISPDGTWALVGGGTGLFLLNLASRERTPLAQLPVPTGRVCWSADGRRLCYPTAEGLAVATLDPIAVRKIDLSASEAVFGPGADDLFACAGDAHAPAVKSGLNRLVRIEGPDGAAKTILEYPCSRIETLALSPDGSRLALVANRDYPRTAAQGGHLYTCALDGSDLRRLTDGPEDFQSVAWAPDGRSLLAVRRLSVGTQGAVGFGGSPDLYRIPAESGEAVNLTRSGGIGATHACGPDLLLRLTEWSVDTSQQGIFRIPAADLQAATASRPVPPVHFPREQGKAVAEAIRKTLGSVRLENLVPTPEWMEKIARSFADAVNGTCGLALDFGPGSLRTLVQLCYNLDLASGREPAVLLGIGAYYGETLRRTVGAEWRIQPMPFGERTLVMTSEENPLVVGMLPFSAALQTAMGSEEGNGLMDADAVRRWSAGRRILLVYPEAQVEETVRAETPPAYFEAMRLLDAGDTKAGIDALIRELEHRPGSGALGKAALDLADKAGMPDAAKEVARRAFEAGTDIPELLMRHGEDLSARDPAAALEVLRKAAQGEYLRADVLLRLGKAYAAAGKRPIAESCWRRAARQWSPEDVKQEIRQLMGVAQATGPESSEDEGD